MKKTTIIIALILLLACIIIATQVNYEDVGKFLMGHEISVKDPHIVKEKIAESTDLGTENNTKSYFVMTVDVPTEQKTYCDERTYYDKNNKVIGKNVYYYNYDRTTDFEIPSNTEKVNVKISLGSTEDGRLLYEENVTKIVEK